MSFKTHKSFIAKSNEALLAVIEELKVKNAELKAANKELKRAIQPQPVSALQKQADKTAVALKKSNDEMQKILENAEASFLLVGKDLNIVVQNNYSKKRTKELFGKELYKGDPIMQLVEPGQREQVKKIFRQALRGQKVNYTYTMLNGDGSLCMLDVCHKPLFNEQGKVDHIMISARDITTEDNSKKALLESEEKYKGLYYNNPLPSWIYDPETMAFLDVNEAAVKQYGYTHEEFLNRSVLDILPAEDVQEFQKLTKKGKGGSWELTGYYRHLTKNGDLLYIEPAGCLITYEGRDAVLVLLHDITNRKKTEDALSQERELSEYFINSLPGLFYVYDKSGKFTRSNSNFQKLSGYTASEVNKMHPLAFVEEKELLAKKLEEVFETGKAEVEVHFITGQGEKIPHYFTGRAAVLEGRQFIIGMGIDITVHKKAEKETEEREQKFLHMLERMLEGIQLYDDTWHCLYINDAAVRQGPYPKKQILKYTLLENYPGFENTELFRIFQDCIAEGESRHIEYEFTFPDGSAKWFELSLQPLKEGFFIHSIDIGERKAAEKAIHDSEEKRRLIMNAALDAIICIDSKGLITFWNPQAEKIFGWKDAEVNGRLLSEIIIPEPYRAMHDKAIEKYLQTGLGAALNTMLELSALNRNGKEFPIELTILPIKQGGQEFFCAFIRDITQRKRSEKTISDSNERYLLVSKATNDSIWDWDLITNEVTRDDKRLEVGFGYEGWEAAEVDYFWNKLAHAGDWARVTERRNAIFKDAAQTYWEDEYRFLRADGEYAYVHDRGFIIRNSEGKPIRMIGASQDISERKKANLELAESEYHLQTIIETEPECIKLLNKKSELLKMNAAGLAMLEADNVEQINVKGVVNIIAAPYRKAFIQVTKDVFEGKTGLLEFEIIGLRGTHRWLETKAVPFKNREGKIVSLLGITRDITERKKAEQSLQYSELRFRSLIEKGSEIIALHDAGGRISYMSPSVEALLGYRSEDRQGKSAFDNVHPDDAPQLKIQLADLLKRPGATATTQWRHLHADGSWRWMDGVATNLLNDPAVQAVVHNFRDITRQKKAEEKIIVERNLLRTLIDNMPDAIYVKDVFGRNIVSNAADLALVGAVSETEVIGKTDLEIFPKDIGSIGYEMDMEAILSGKPRIRYERQFINAAGKKIWLLTSKIPLFNPQGETIGLVGISTNITHLKEIEAELLRSNERFDYATKATFDAIWDWDLITNSLYWGEGFEKLFGYALSNGIADIQSWICHLHPDDLDRVTSGIYKVIDSRENNWTGEYRYLKANGDYAYVLDRGIVIRDENGKGIRMIGAMQDYTRKKKEEEQLKLLESVITNTTDSIMITEAEPIDGEGPRIIYVNDAFTKMTGYAREEVIGKTPRILQGPKTDRKELDRLRGTLQKWEPCKTEIINYKKNGEAFWINISIVPVSDEKGRVTHFIAVESDVTQRKLAEEELKEKNSELKRLSAYLLNVREEERKYIAREVHDELGQLASALKIDIDWLGIKIAGLEESAKNRITHANKTIEILITTIRKIASSLRPSVLDDFGLNAALQWHCAEFQNLNGIPCTFEPGFDDKGLAMNIKTELFRIGQESLTNAMRHAKASTIVISTREDAGNFYLTITDNGIGFDTNQRKNTLGLLGLRERAVSLNGQLHIESTIGKGTSVFAVIPKK